MGELRYNQLCHWSKGQSLIPVPQFRLKAALRLMKLAELMPPVKERPSPACGGTCYPCCRWSREDQRLAGKAFRKENRRYCREILREDDGAAFG